MSQQRNEEAVWLGALGFVVGAGLVALAAGRRKARPSPQPPASAPVPAAAPPLLPQKQPVPSTPVKPAFACVPAVQVRPPQLVRRRGRWVSYAAAAVGSLLLHAAVFATPWMMTARPHRRLAPPPEPARESLRVPGPAWFSGGADLAPLLLPTLALPEAPELGLLVSGGENAATGVTPVDASADEATEFSVVAAGDAGGALPDLGVLGAGPVVTLYLEHPPGGWSLECARIFPLAAGEPSAGRPLDPPQVVGTVEPRWAAGALTTGAGAMLAVEGELDRSGRLTGLRVLRSPSSGLNAAAIGALSGWRFRPASVDRVPVEVRVLFGVPLPARR